MAAKTRTRVRAGVPSGGQFAADAHDEADIDGLLDSMGFAELDPAEAMEIASRAARRLAHKTPRVDAAEVSQDTLLNYLNARNNARTKLWDAYTNGVVVRPGSVLENPGAYINRVAEGIVQRHATGEDQSPDRAAIKAWRQAVADAEQHLGRDLTQNEKDDLANHIRESQAPGRRAKVGFHEARGEVTASSFGDDDAVVVDDVVGADGRLLSAGDITGDFSPDEIGDALLESFSAGRASAAQNARRRAWDAVAGRSGAPMVVQGSLTEGRVTAARRTISEAGGISSVCARWADETASVDETNALFAPFGNNLDYSAQARVVSAIGDLGAYADDVFDGALGGATRSRVDKKVGVKT